MVGEIGKRPEYTYHNADQRMMAHKQKNLENMNRKNMRKISTGSIMILRLYYDLLGQKQAFSVYRNNHRWVITLSPLKSIIPRKLRIFASKTSRILCTVLQHGGEIQHSV